MLSEKYPLNKILKTAQYILYGLFALIGIGICLQLMRGRGNWMIHPIIAYILSLGVSVCISIIFLIPTYYSWTHNAEEYWEWYLDQITPIFRRVWTIFWEQEIWGSYTLWSARLIGPIGFLMGLTGVIYALYEILNFFFSGN